MDSKDGDMMIKMMCSISHTSEDEVFVQTNIFNKDKTKFTPISTAEYLHINEEDCIDLATALSYCFAYVVYEDENFHTIEIVDGKIIKEYDNP